jgi:hypothetical protein
VQKRNRRTNTRTSETANQQNEIILRRVVHKSSTSEPKIINGLHQLEQKGFEQLGLDPHSQKEKACCNEVHQQLSSKLIKNEITKYKLKRIKIQKSIKLKS